MSGQPNRAPLVGEDWLMHCLNFSGERVMPAMPGLLAQPFWLDPSDPHRMASVMQVNARPLQHSYAAALGNWRHDLVEQRTVWETAVHAAATARLSPQQAVDDAIARIKEILSEELAGHLLAMLRRGCSLPRGSVL